MKINKIGNVTEDIVVVGTIIKLFIVGLLLVSSAVIAG
jgi:hypothetical protein